MTIDCMLSTKEVETLCRHDEKIIVQDIKNKI